MFFDSRKMIVKMNSVVMAAVLALVAHGAGTDVPQPLFENGRTAWVVVVPDAPSKYMNYAARELATTLKKISGATFEIVEAAKAPAFNVLRLKSDCRHDLYDEFSVKETPGEIVFSGNTQRGTLFAVYAFLRERLGARWYWPGQSGEFLPQLSRYDATKREKTWRPFSKRAKCRSVQSGATGMQTRSVGFRRCF